MNTDGSEKRTENLVKNTAVLTLGNICTKGIMFIMTPLFTRWLSQGDYGTFDLLVTYLSLITPIVTIDIKSAVFRFLLDERYKNDKVALITNGVIAHLFSFGICVVISCIIYFIIPEKKILIIYYFFMVLAETLYNFWTVIARGLRKVPVFAKGNIVYILMMALASFVFVYLLHGGLYGLMLSYTIGYVISCAYMSLACKIWNYIDFKKSNFRLLREMNRYALPMLPNEVAWWIMNVSDRTLVSVFLGVEANAILSVTSKLPNLCQQLFSKFHLSWQETAVDSINLQDRDTYFSGIMNELFRIMCSFIILVLSFNFVYFRFLFNEDYFGGYYLCPVLMVAILLYMLTQFLGGIYIAQMQPKKNGGTTVISAAVNLLIDLALIKFIGLWAAVLSTLIAYTVLFIIRFLDIRNEIRLKFERKAYVYIAVLAYFVVSNYANNVWLNIINMIVGCAFFTFINKKYVNLILMKIKKKSRGGVS